MHFSSRSLLAGAAVGLTLSLSLAAQHPRCKTPPRDLLRPAPDNPSDCAYSSTTPAGQYATISVYRIPVVFHVIRTTGGNGNISAAQIQNQVDILNEDFRALAGTPGAPGFDTGIEFYLPTTDPQGQPSTGITYSTNNNWFNDGGSYWNSLAWDPNRYLNIYTNNGGGALGYVPDLPQGGIVGQKSDRVVVLWSTVGRNAPYGAPFNQGRTVTHEVGHYLGLWHTFDRGCGLASSCYTTGDVICDTNRESFPTNGCGNGKSSCGSPDPVNNYMDYSDDRCMWEFTSEQARRMRCTLEFWRPNLAQQCAIASATSRTAGANLQSYSAAPPVVGESFSGSVDTSTSGHNMALLMAAVSSAQTPIGNGYRALVDLSGAVVLGSPASGPNASFGFAIPLDLSICGNVLYTQAAHFGGAAGFALSNAQDLTFGR